MKKFKFKFDTVLKVRKRREEDALLSLAATQRAYQTELAKKAELVAVLQNALKRREAFGNQPASVAEVLAEQDYIIGTKQRITQVEQAIFRTRKWVEKALRAYLVARTQSRILETLYTKSYQEHKKEMAKRTQKEMDDLLLMRSRLKEKEIE